MRCAAFRWTRPSPVDGSRAAAHAGSAHRAAPRAVTAAPKSKQRSIRFYERRVVAHSAGAAPPRGGGGAVGVDTTQHFDMPPRLTWRHAYTPAATGPSATSPPPPPQEEEAGRGGTAARPASATGTDSGAAAAAAGASPRMEAQQTLEQYKIIYDRLIKIFEERPRDDWKKLIVFSKQWAEHSQGASSAP